MNQNYLSGLFFPAVAGLFFFMKRPEVEETQMVYPTYSGEQGGLTGVAKYLEKQNHILLENKKAKELLVSQEITLVVSGVTRYLEKRDHSPVTGVTKYTRRQALAEKQAKKEISQLSVTGVGKYLKNQKDLPVLSGVAKYLKHQDSLPKASKVAKYVARQALAEKQAKQTQALVHVEETGVTKYLKQQENLPQLSRVAKYLAKQALLSKKEKQLVVKIELTGVAKYMKKQEGLPQVSRVSKYMARQSLASRQKPIIIETGVDRYMRHQG
ncbi:MAG: hypothetical protein Q8N96_01040 [Methylovulum sp.]|nr:hypothetical protein [Methylovulum sp.]